MQLCTRPCAIVLRWMPWSVEPIVMVISSTLNSGTSGAKSTRGRMEPVAHDEKVTDVAKRAA